MEQRKWGEAILNPYGFFTTTKQKVVTEYINVKKSEWIEACKILNEFENGKVQIEAILCDSISVCKKAIKYFKELQKFERINLKPLE
jgi:hypothetical protein